LKRGLDERVRSYQVKTAVVVFRAVITHIIQGGGVVNGGCAIRDISVAMLASHTVLRETEVRT
jgi:hypothetical protein